MGSRRLSYLERRKRKGRQTVRTIGLWIGIILIVIGFLWRLQQSVVWNYWEMATWSILMILAVSITVYAGNRTMQWINKG